MAEGGFCAVVDRLLKAVDRDTGIIMGQDLLPRCPLVGHGVGAVLAHADAVAVTGDIED